MTPVCLPPARQGLAPPWDAGGSGPSYSSS